MTYPESKKQDIVDTLWDQSIPDPYRWLEDDNSNETKQWVQAQNKVTHDYLNNISFRKDIETRYSGLIDYE
ncbi:MAG: S9 family peptidase, partial [Flavobacteriales bacterium]|nr:S9 family peptidase [Flavobacteriales bacterium]